MRSSARQSPLNSSKSALSSASSSSLYISFSSLLSSLSFTSITTATTSSLTSPSSKSSPRLPSTASLFSVSFILLVLFHCCLVVTASPPVFHSSHQTLENRNGELIVERTTYFTRNLTWDGAENGSMLLQADMPQMDEPQRNLHSGADPPERWRQAYQNRHAYLLTKSNQYVYIKHGRIMGTTEKYKRGIVKLSSHNMKLVIQSLHDDTFVCMNASGHLYMSVPLNKKDCVIYETPLRERGFSRFSYEFVEHRSSKKSLYLGIDCNPVNGRKTKIEQESSRFNLIYITSAEAERAKQDVGKGVEESLKDEPKCLTVKKKKKLRAKWCREYTKIRQTIVPYLNRCNKKYCKSRGKRKCVCSMLANMYRFKEKTKRECLMEHVTNWVKKRKARPNKVFIKSFADLLAPKYDSIMKRIREQRRLKKNKKPKNKVTEDAEATPLTTISTHKRNKNKKPKNRKRKRGKKSKKVRLSFLLKRYWPQLTEATRSTTAQSSYHYQNDSPSSSVSAPAPPSGMSSLGVDRVMPKLSPSLSSILSSSSSSSQSSESSLSSSTSSSSSSSSSLLLHHLRDVSNNDKIGNNDKYYNDKITTSSLPSFTSKLLRSVSNSSPDVSSTSSSSSSSSSSRSSTRKHRVRHRKRRRKNRKLKDSR